MKDKKIKKVLVIGSGPIVIGQAAEFDYSGTQVCLALKEDGVKTVLLNSNPATIQTDTTVADKIYFEPMNCEVLEKIINIEWCDCYCRWSDCPKSGNRIKKRCEIFGDWIRID